MGLLSNTIRKVEKPAVLIGNGINLCSSLFPSWDQLLKDLSGVDFNSRGLTYTEMYDMIELRAKQGKNVKGEIAKSFEQNSENKISEVHNRFVNLMIKNNCAVLTTNFDFTLEHTLFPNRGNFFRTSKNHFTDYYPWDTYFGLVQHSLPTDGFGIWHIHGMINYYRSIRLGLTDYMGSVERARTLIHKGPDNIFRGKNQNEWDGRTTWLHIWFNRPLIIVGLKLDKDEIFIRWLCIEREKYFRKFPDRRQETYYLSKGDSPHNEGFLTNLNMKLCKSKNYLSLYS